MNKKLVEKLSRILSVVYSSQIRAFDLLFLWVQSSLLFLILIIKAKKTSTTHRLSQELSANKTYIAVI